jgi:hypothetical protein
LQPLDTFFLVAALKIFFSAAAAEEPVAAVSPRSFAHQASIAIYNSQLYEESRKLVETLAANQQFDQIAALRWPFANKIRNLGVAIEQLERHEAQMKTHPPVCLAGRNNRFQGRF